MYRGETNLVESNNEVKVGECLPRKFLFFVLIKSPKMYLAENAQPLRGFQTLAVRAIET